MTSADVMRLYALLDELKKDNRASLGEVRDEVKGYRADLNGRLRTLEHAEARRNGVEIGRGTIGRITVSAAGVAAAVASVITLIVRFT